MKGDKLLEELNSSGIKSIIDALENADFQDLLSNDNAETDPAAELTTRYSYLINNVLGLNPEKVSISREDLRRVFVDGKEYDLDAIVKRSDPEAKECLCAIDAIAADVARSELSGVLEKVEKEVSGK